VRIKLSMRAILDEAGRKFNADKLDGISRRDRRFARSGSGEFALPSVCERGSQIQCSRGSAWARAREQWEPPRSRASARAGVVG
jgi:hypothetical protein